MNLLVLCAGGHFQMGWVFVSVFPPCCLIWCLVFIYTQVNLLSLKYKLLHIFSFLLSITSLKEIDILESSNWIVTKGTVIEMLHHADMMSLLCTHSIVCIPLLHHYRIISISPTGLEIYPGNILCLISLFNHLQYRLNKHSAEPDIILGGKSLM